MNPRLIVALAVLPWAVCRGADGEPPDAVPPVPSAPSKAVVYFAESPSAVEGGNVRSGAVRAMVDSLVMAATGRPDTASAWRSLVNPQDRVGIKVSTAGAPVSSTHAVVVEAVAEGLVAAGVSPARIVIWDRKWDDIRRAGYVSLSRRFVVTSTDQTGGYDAEQFVTAAAMGRLIVGDREFDPKHKGGEQTSSRSHISRVLTGGVDKVVHLPALTDHLGSGLNGALSGMVLDNLDNWRRLARSPHFGDPFLPEIYSDPRIGGKVVLTILDALRPQYAGGPFPGAEYVVNHGALFASRDPVAIDLAGLAVLDDFRREAGMPLLSKKVTWPESAEVIGLGVGTRENIRLVRLGASPERAAP